MFRVAFCLIQLFASFVAFNYADSDVSYYICESEVPSLLGKYTKSEFYHNDIPVWKYKDYSMYRHNEFWYIGSLVEWPPKTYYRCVDFEGSPNVLNFLYATHNLQSGCM